MYLNVRKSHKLPTEDFDGMDDVRTFVKACVEIYQKRNQPYAARSQEDIAKGYYHEKEGNKIECINDTSNPKVQVDLSWADEMEIKDCFDSETSILLVAHGRKQELHDLKGDFVTAGVTLPPKDKVKWVLSDDFNPKEEAAPPAAAPAADPPQVQKRRRAAAAPSQQEAAADDSSALSATLRRRRVSW